MDIFHISDEQTFRAVAMEVFRFQTSSVPVYAEYLSTRGISAEKVLELEEIPFLPIEFFKSHRVIAGGMEAEEVFESSGTTEGTTARHYVADASLYRESFLRGFFAQYGSPEDLCILALLPSYLERSGSSLVYMTDLLIRWSKHPDSGFYLDNLEALAGLLRARSKDMQPTLLLGVSFALLDLAEAHPMLLGDNVTLMETGGMKGRRKELVREELQGIRSRAFGRQEIHAEYGMTELLSQAYSSGNGIFRCPPWMEVSVRDPNDPLSQAGEGQAGGLNIIDLANRYSCSFIATSDLGRTHPDGSFEVTGRFDHSDIRGCNLLLVP